MSPHQTSEIQTNSASFDRIEAPAPVRFTNRPLALTALVCAALSLMGVQALEQTKYGVAVESRSKQSAAPTFDQQAGRSFSESELLSNLLDVDSPLLRAANYRQQPLVSDVSI